MSDTKIPLLSDYFHSLHQRLHLRSSCSSAVKNPNSKYLWYYSIDAILLIYASDTSSPEHSAACDFLTGRAADPDLMCLTHD